VEAGHNLSALALKWRGTIRESQVIIIDSSDLRSEQRKCSVLTIHCWTRLVSTKVLWRSRCWVETWRALGTQVRRHALRLRGLLWRRCQARAALSCTAGHNTTKQIARSMANLRRLGLGWAAVLRVLAGTAAGLYFALELGNPVLVSL
jgi:hypothetical protein